MNTFKGFIRSSSVYFQIFLLIGLALFGAGLLGAMGFFACQTFFGVSFTDVQQFMADPTLNGAVAPLKMLQIFSSIGLFLLPAMVFSQLFSPQPETFLRLKNTVSWPIGVSILLLIIVFTPITDALTWLNHQIHLPEFLASFEHNARMATENTQALLGTFLRMETFLDFAYNLFLLAILPAVAEEFFFRGVVQELLIRHTQRTHLSIWVTALAFALMHGQIFALVPLLVLGALLGYLKQWTGSLWASIIGHFVNNGLIVVVMYFFAQDLSDLDGLSTPQISYLLGGIVLAAGIIFYLFRNRSTPYLADEDLIDEKNEADDYDGM